MLTQYIVAKEQQHCHVGQAVCEVTWAGLSILLEIIQQNAKKIGNVGFLSGSTGINEPFGQT